MHYWFSMVISAHSSFFKTKNIQKQSFNFWWNLGWFIIYMKKRFVTHFCSVWGMRKRNMLIKCTKLRKNIRKICHSYVGKLVLIFWLMPYRMPLLTLLHFKFLYWKASVCDASRFCLAPADAFAWLFRILSLLYERIV